MAGMQTKRVALIIGSQRRPRVCPQICAFVSHIVVAQNSPGIQLETVDIAEAGLPLDTDEPKVPAQVKELSGYKNEDTRDWSRKISGFHGFIFVTPQYNWSVPAGLKNAIDYLYHEWVGKPTMIVTYGGHGGDKVDAAMRIILGGGLRMPLVEKHVNLAFPDRQVQQKAAEGQDLGLSNESEDGIWHQEREGILEAWSQLCSLLARM